MKRQFKLFGIAFIITVLSALVFGAISVNAATVYRRGDVNLDGEITISDATIVQMYLGKLTQFTEEQKVQADVNEDGYIDINDATEIQRCVAGLTKIYFVKFTAGREVINPDAMPYVQGGFVDIKVPDNKYKSRETKFKTFFGAGYYMQRQSDNKWLYTCDSSNVWCEEGKENKGYYKKIFYNNSGESITKYVSKNKETIILQQQFTPDQISLEIDYNFDNFSKKQIGTVNPITQGVTCPTIDKIMPKCTFDYYLLRWNGKYYSYGGKGMYKWTEDINQAYHLYSKQSAPFVMFEKDFNYNGMVTLEAHWKYNNKFNFTIIFKGNNETSGCMSPQTKEYGKYGAISPNMFKKIGYNFRGWYASKTVNGINLLYVTDKNGNNYWATSVPTGGHRAWISDKWDGYFSRYATDMVNGTVTLTAKWDTANCYALSILGPELGQNVHSDEKMRMAFDACTRLRGLSSLKFARNNKLWSATYYTLEKKIKESFENSSANDLCYLYIHAHGIESNNEPTGEVRLFTNYGDISGNELRKLIEKYCRGHVVIMLDSCFAAKFIKSGGFNNNSKYTAICACTENQVSWYDLNNTGYATYYWALGGGYDCKSNKCVEMAADENHNGEVTIGELKKYTNDNISSMQTCVTYGYSGIKYDNVVVFSRT